jgi:hypothetical protein
LAHFGTGIFSGRYQLRIGISVGHWASGGGSPDAK